MKKRLIIIDVSNFIFRAFYAIRPLNAPDGTPVNAVYGVLSMFLKIFQQYQPTHLLLARDNKDGSFRNEIFPEYKANRTEPPEDLIPQFSLVDELIEKLKLPTLRLSRYEADDIIGSAIVQFKSEFDEILVASGDKDLMQFVDDKVMILDTMKDKIYHRHDVFEKMGVYPEQIVDYLSLTGDSSDNIPGVAGIGAKGAAKLLEEFKDLDTLLKNIDKITNKRAQKAFLESPEAAAISKKLVQIVTDLDLGRSIDNLKFQIGSDDALVAFFKQLGFKNMLEKVLAFSTRKSVEGISEVVSSTPIETSSAVFTEVITNPEWKKVFDLIKTKKKLALVPFWADNSYYFGSLLYLGVMTEDGVVYLLRFGKMLRPESVFRDIVELNKTQIIVNDIKYLFCFLILNQIKIPAQFFDIGQAHFQVDPSRSHTTSSLAAEYTGENFEEFNWEKAGNLFELDTKMKDYIYLSTKSLIQIQEKLEQNINELGCQKVFYEIDQPLIPILAEMEMRGIGLDVQYFNTLEIEYSRKLADIQAQVDAAGGDGVNLRSPKQLQVLLFEKLNLPALKKTKTGASTDSSVLEELDAMGTSEIPGLILQYRELDKLLSTYVKVLPKLVNPMTKKIHTHFQLNVAATGRLSSDNPNLQNIPMRSENGRRLRKGFIPTPGMKLLSADYSQVELRILAHLAQDQTMLKAFKEERDIHAQTASEVHGKPVESVTKDERSQAKAINFGLMYGQSSFGLSEQLKISRTEAKNYIDKYFMRFNKIKSFLDGLKEKAEATGYAETIFGRKRVLKDIHSQNRTVKSMAERVAINSPIQGTAADIIKIAMINLERSMREKKLKSQMILQIHDELVFEVAPDELELMQNLVRDKMENATAMSVPLKVEMGFGSNWFDLE
ncbi:MAG: DNA polymerase I [Bacteriovoracaceae bacterium]|nr:DNA polymerase I [Bacteriovoracaceae bacterium]